MKLNSEHLPSSILAALRDLIPNRDMTFAEALHLAELQAIRLLELSDVTDAPVPDEVVLSLPRVERRYHQLRGTSGMTYWNGQTWVIGINSTEPLTRQRFTLLHEFKHIIDHGAVSRLYHGDHLRSSHGQAELAAEYFAGCVLVPKRQLSQAWYRGQQHALGLARYFDVSLRAIEMRLRQVGLIEEPPVTELPGTGHLWAERSAKRYFRTAYATTASSMSWEHADA